MIVDTGPEPVRGRTNVDQRGRSGWERNCHVAVAVESDRCLELEIDWIAALD